jgi:hypothetical protein
MPIPTRHPRIQVTEDPELARAIELAVPHLPTGLSRSGTVRELAMIGARCLSNDPADADRRALLRRLATRFEHPESAGVDWDLGREGKHRAWPSR